ncbi:hypothetical protein F4803DRAFT_504822 [Xylaria telfairii]|nr:hypothetical protein F4803DRAFT_504822 [Xylaria telfairii]
MSKLLWPRKISFVWLFAATSNLISASNVLTTDIITSDGPPPLLTTGCLNNSLTAPTWTVESFHYEEDDSISTVNFILTSNSIPGELDCFGQATGHSLRANGECTDQDRKHVYSAQFVFDASTRDLSIEQAWACDDNTARVPVGFVGTGIKKLVLDCKSSECISADPIRIPAKLLEPIKLSPYIPPAPPGHDSPGCSFRSKSPSWTISDLEWRTGGKNYTWQSWIISGTGIAGVGMVKLNITSKATQQTFSCVWHSQGQETSNVTIIGPPSGVFPFPLDPGPAWYRCDTHSLNENENRTHNYEVETLVRLISGEKRLLVNQTWYCDDEEPASPVKFYAVGAVELPSLSCRERREIEPDAADSWDLAGTPVVNGSLCVSSEFDINGEIKSHYTMEPYALELPNPEASKCTVLSMDPDKQYLLVSTAYVFRSHWWYFWRDGEPKGGFDVTILTFVTKQELTCSGFDSKLNPNGTDFDPDYWFDCSFPISYPAMIRNMRVNYNAHTDILSVRISWTCNELSPQNPIVFTAFASGQISKPECADDSDGTTRCLFPAPNNIPLPFTNITWDTL